VREGVAGKVDEQDGVEKEKTGIVWGNDVPYSATRFGVTKRERKTKGSIA